MVTAFARYALECRAVEVEKVLESGRLCLTLEGSHTLPLEVLSILYPLEDHERLTLVAGLRHTLTALEDSNLLPPWPG